jgi:hypothetical protein
MRMRIWGRVFTLEKAPIKTGKVVGMQKSYSEGLANHIGLESCGGNGNIAAEALTEVRAGRVLSPVMKTSVPGVDVFQEYGKQHFMSRNGEAHKSSAGSETPGMHRDILRGNRETLHLACSVEVRMENPKGIRPW